MNIKDSILTGVSEINKIRKMIVNYTKNSELTATSSLLMYMKGDNVLTKSSEEDYNEFIKIDSIFFECGAVVNNKSTNICQTNYTPQISKVMINFKSQDPAFIKMLTSLSKGTIFGENSIIIHKLKHAIGKKKLLSTIKLGNAVIESVNIQGISSRDSNEEQEAISPMQISVVIFPNKLSFEYLTTNGSTVGSINMQKRSVK